MQNPQMAQMGMNANPGPVDGTPVMANAPRPRMAESDSIASRDQLNTYIYDYFLRNNHTKLAAMMITCDLNMNLGPGGKRSPNQLNGVDSLEEKDLPPPKLPEHQLSDNSFLLDWWCQFWDVFKAARGRAGKPASAQYIAHTRNLAQMQNEQRNQRMMMNMNGSVNPAQYNMMRNMQNGVPPNDLKRAAVMRNQPGGNPMGNMNPMNKQAMMSAQMQRDGSNMDMNGQRPQSPGSTENAPSPNKRPRVDGGMNAGNMAGNQFNEFNSQAQGVQQKSIEGMNSGVQGSPMNQGLENHAHDMFAGNQPRPGLQNAPAGQPGGNHALQDYQMQLMLLEQQNKKRLLMARQEQDSMSGHPGQAGGPGFPPTMSPQGSRAGPSPNPTDQMKRGTPKMNQPGLPGSPMPDGSMQQRNSPAPGGGNMAAFDPSQMPPGMPPQFGYPQGMQQNPMMRPPSSHPQFNGQPLTPQQMEAMRRSGAMPPNGWPQNGPQQGMMPNQQQMPMGTPQQRGQMPPPPAPTGEQPRTQEPSPQQPAAPPTPSQKNKANPKKPANKKDNKKPANAKGANTGATPSASNGEEPPTPTPSTPITPLHPQSFKNGQPQPPAQQPAQVQPPVAPPQQQQQQPPMDNGNAPFGAIEPDTSMDFSMGFGEQDTLENFDFDSFLHVDDGTSGFGNIGDFTFGDTAEVGLDQ